MGELDVRPQGGWYRRKSLIGGALLATALAVFCACTVPSRMTSNDSPQFITEPSHRVTYRVSTIGTANDSLQITYTAGGGNSENDTAPGFSMYWSNDVTTDRGTTFVALQASGISSDLAFRMQCSIVVDGQPAATSAGYSFCNATVDFNTARSSSTAPLSDAPSPTVPPSVPSQAAPAGCRFTDRAEVASILTKQTHVVKPVLDTTASEQECTFVFDYQSSYVKIAWTPGGKVTYPPAGPAVSGLGGKAYYVDFGTFSRLEVQLPKGLLVVEPHLYNIQDVDAKAYAIELFKAVRPRVP